MALHPKFKFENDIDEAIQAARKGGLSYHSISAILERRSEIALQNHAVNYSGNRIGKYKGHPGLSYPD